MQFSLPSAAVFRAQSIDHGISTCDGFKCDILHIVADSSAIIFAIISGLFVITTLSYVRDAHEACQQEQGRVVDECTAFTEFADRIKYLDTYSRESYLDDALVAEIVGES